jgi:glutaconate CoA-transferase subunit B
MKPDPETKEFEVVSLHPGVTRERVSEGTGWRVRFAATLEVTRAPEPSELDALRDLNARTARAHGTAAGE